MEKLICIKVSFVKTSFTLLLMLPPCWIMTAWERGMILLSPYSKVKGEQMEELEKKKFIWHIFIDWKKSPNLSSALYHINHLYHINLIDMIQMIDIIQIWLINPVYLWLLLKQETQFSTSYILSSKTTHAVSPSGPKFKTYRENQLTNVRNN